MHDTLDGEGVDELETMPVVLTVELSSNGSLDVLTLCGELCSTSIAALEAHVDQLSSLPSRRIALDVSRLTRVDLVGARVIAGMRHYVEALGGHLIITGATEELVRMLGDSDPRWPPVEGPQDDRGDLRT